MTSTGNYLVLAENDEEKKHFKIHVQSTINETAIRSLRGHNNYIANLRLSPNDVYLVSVDNGDSDGNNMLVWDFAKGTCLYKLDYSFGYSWQRFFCFSPDSKFILYKCIKDDDADSGLRLHSLDSKKMVKCFKTLQVEKFKNDWDEDGSEPYIIHETKCITINFVCFSQNGRQIIGSMDRTVYIWTVDTQPEQLFKNVQKIEIDDIEGHFQSVNYFCSSLDSSRLVVASSSDSHNRSYIHIWSLSSLKRLHILHGHVDSSILAICMLPDGIWFASSDYHSIRIWSVLAQWSVSPCNWFM